MFFVYKVFGEHIIGMMEIKEKESLTSQEKLKNSILKICKNCGLNIVGEKYHKFDKPGGITYCFILSQSHLIIHSWPEESKLFFDIFTCTNDKKGEDCVMQLSKEFGGKIISLKKIKL